jgi:hypothetical protein
VIHHPVSPYANVVLWAIIGVWWLVPVVVVGAMWLFK